MRGTTFGARRKLYWLGLKLSLTLLSNNELMVSNGTYELPSAISNNEWLALVIRRTTANAKPKSSLHPVILLNGDGDYNFINRINAAALVAAITGNH